MRVDKQEERDIFISLFRGRGDVYGHEEGKCVKEPLTVEVFDKHLWGMEYIGVYPMVPFNGTYYVQWGCSDIDIEDITLARRLQAALHAAGVTSWVERSRSKGYHVWVFADEPVPASDMRRMLLVAHQVADVPAREVNPKQETLAQGQYGNYVRLPYACADQVTDKRRILDDNDQPTSFYDFVKLADAYRVPAKLIAELASFYREPQKEQRIIEDYEPCGSLSDAMSVLSPLGKVIWRDGPLEGRDRSSTITKLGYECVRCGMNPSQTKVILASADKRWGKYHLRANSEHEIDKLVARVFN